MVWGWIAVRMKVTGQRIWTQMISWELIVLAQSKMESLRGRQFLSRLECSLCPPTLWNVVGVPGKTLILSPNKG